MDLQTIFPYSGVVSRKWLLDHGVEEHTIKNCIRSGRWVKLGTGVYRWREFPVKQAALLASMARVWSESVVVGGKTALAMQGLGHYLSAGTTAIELYTRGIAPRWIAALIGNSVPAQFHTSGKLWKSESSFTIGTIQWRDPSWDEPYLISSPERAVLELLHDLPDRMSFTLIDELFQGLTLLSPRKLTELLNVCGSIKVKRLFFWFADRNNHPWRKHLDVTKFDLGAGKRVIAVGGKLDNTYLITVPLEMNNDRSF